MPNMPKIIREADVPTLQEAETLPASPNGPSPW